MHIIDELPYQLQKRDFAIDMKIKPGEELEVIYKIRPVLRGEYVFRKINIYASTGINLISRKFAIDAEQAIPVYPSIIQMKNYELKTMSRISFFEGVKKIIVINFQDITNKVIRESQHQMEWGLPGRKKE